MSESPWKGVRKKQTAYRVTDEGPQGASSSRVPGAEIVVKHPQTAYMEDPAHNRDNVDHDGDLSRIQTGDGPAGQTSLFGVSHMHPHVSWMAAGTQFRGHIPTLLATAATETRARFGEDLRSDTSLSEHSSAIVHRLAEAGATKVPEHQTHNTHTAADIYYTTSRLGAQDGLGESVQEIPESTTRTSRQFLRAALRRTRQSVPTSSPASGGKNKQQKLFGEGP